MDADRGAARLAVLEEIGALGPLRREIARCAAPELHSGAAAVIWHLALHGPLRTSDLAAGLQVDVSVVSRQSAELAAAGYLQRRPDPHDGRACLLSLTGSGRAALEAAMGRLAVRFEDRLADWDAEELLRVAADLRRLREDLLPPAPATPSDDAPVSIRTSASAAS